MGHSRIHIGTRIIRSALATIGIGLFPLGLLLSTPGDTQSSILRDHTSNEAEHTIQLYDYGFRITAPFHVGKNSIHVQNHGNNTHELVVVRLNEGYRAKDYVEAIDSGFSLTEIGKGVGGMPPLAKGQDRDISVTLQPGLHFLTCFQFDQDTGKPHMMLGMVHEFELE